MEILKVENLAKTYGEGDNIVMLFITFLCR